ncbi:hypothetical protein ACQPZP_26260 [Spirillospora sp. CA-142024]|uniref:hypothetical protein n=1 Tax=Spirillospora sp. CA-142024 TaxID=3240036 RepID=UPI003D8D4E80
MGCGLDPASDFDRILANPALLLVGWAVPLLGITLLAFVVIDAALGVLRRRRAVVNRTA